MPAAIKATAVGRSERLQEMRFESLRRDSGKAARACARGQFFVHFAVITYGVIRREDLGKVVEDKLVIEFREATGATACEHGVPFVEISRRPRSKNGGLTARPEGKEGYPRSRPGQLARAGYHGRAMLAQMTLPPNSWVR